MLPGGAAPRRPRAAGIALLALAGAQVRYGRWGSRSPAATRGLLVGMLAVSTAEAVEARGRRAGTLAVLCPGAIGYAAEIVGVATGRPFGRYHYSERLGPRFSGVPVLAAAAWAILARPAWVAAGWATRRRSLRVPLAAAALTGWDVYLDPRMVAEGYWTWSAGGRYENIPATNFLGWWVTGLCVFSALAALDRAAVEPRDDAALALYTWTWLGEAFANGMLWGRPRVAAAGAAAMGAVAAPALRARLDRSPA